MKKDRNSFFSEYGYNSIQSNPNMVMPNQGAYANSTFYSGPMPNNMNNNMYGDLDSRLSKIERQLNRLETRVSRLEGDNNINNDDINYNNTMYMV